MYWGPEYPKPASHPPVVPGAERGGATSAAKAGPPCKALGFGGGFIRGLGFRLGFRGLGFGVLGFGFWVWGCLGFGVLGFWGFGVLGFWGFGVLGFGGLSSGFRA